MPWLSPPAPVAGRCAAGRFHAAGRRTPFWRFRQAVCRDPVVFFIPSLLVLGYSTKLLTPIYLGPGSYLDTYTPLVATAVPTHTGTLPSPTFCHNLPHLTMVLVSAIQIPAGSASYSQCATSAMVISPSPLPARAAFAAPATDTVHTVPHTHTRAHIGYACIRYARTAHTPTPRTLPPRTTLHTHRKTSCAHTTHHYTPLHARYMQDVLRYIATRATPPPHRTPLPLHCRKLLALHVYLLLHAPRHTAPHCHTHTYPLPTHAYPTPRTRHTHPLPLHLHTPHTTPPATLPHAHIPPRTPYTAFPATTDYPTASTHMPTLFTHAVHYPPVWTIPHLQFTHIHYLLPSPPLHTDH